MYRFRKKSDAQRSRAAAAPPPSLPPIDAALPPASDFRTSLILPSLTRRFTLLRSENGDHIALQDVKHRLLQRRGQAVDQLTEEEEDMVMEALGKARLEENQSTGPPSSPEGPLSASPSLYMDGAPVSPSSSMRSPRSSNRTNNRRSNNLFGSHVDYPLPSRRSRPSTITTQGSTGGSDSQEQADDTSHQIDRGSGLTSPKFPHSQVPLGQSRSLSPRLLSVPALGRMNRVSQALEQVLDEIETHAVQSDLPPLWMNSRPRLRDPRTNVVDPAFVSDEDQSSDQPLQVEGIAVFPANHHSREGLWTAPLGYATPAPMGYDSIRASSVSPPPVAGDPARRLPGYIPGMHRPITPRREVDAKEPEHSIPTSHNSIVPSPSHSQPRPSDIVDPNFPPGPPTTYANIFSWQDPIQRSNSSSDEPDSRFAAEPHLGVHSSESSRSQEVSSPPVNGANGSSLARVSPTFSRKKNRGSASPSPRTARRQSLSASEEPGFHGRAFQSSDAWSSGDELHRSSRAGYVSRSPPPPANTQQTPPPERWRTFSGADSPGRWVPSGSSSASSRIHQGHLTLSSRFSTSSSSLSLGSSYHSSTDNVSRLEKGPLVDAAQNITRDRWDATLQTDKSDQISQGTSALERTPNTADYENALSVLGISQQEAHAIEARLLQSLDAVHTSIGISGVTTDNRRQRRSSTPYSVRSTFSGEDTEAGMATETTVTPKRAGHNSSTSALAPAPLNTTSSPRSGKLSRNDAILAMLESLPSPQNQPKVFQPTQTPAPLVSPIKVTPDQGSLSSSQEGVTGTLGDGPLDLSPALATRDHFVGREHFGQELSGLTSTQQNKQRPDDPELMKDMERQTAAATAFLKTTPSLPKLIDRGPSSRKTLKRINPQHIGSPQLLSSSMTSEGSALPLSPSLVSIPQADKPFGLLRRLRNSVKARPPASSDDDHPRSSPKTPPPLGSLSRATTSSATHARGGDKEEWRESPGTGGLLPAGQVGLKGFMARFRRSRREQDSGTETSSGLVPAVLPQKPAAFSSQQRSRSALSLVPATVPSHTQPSRPTQLPTSLSGVSLPDLQAGDQFSPTPKRSPTEATNLASSQAEIGLPPSHVNRSISLRVTGATAYNAEQSGHKVPNWGTSDTQLLRQPSLRTTAQSTHNEPQLKSEDSGQYAIGGRSQVVRRTLYVAGSGMLSAEQISAVRKSIAGHSRIGSVSSDVSMSRSIRDRAPTPPPNRASSRRLVGDLLPPVPSLESSAIRSASRTNSLREGDSAFSASVALSGSLSGVSGRTSESVRAGPSESQIPADAGIELLELSNGQVIWSVVDGLRAGIADEVDEDDRSSFTSEFSMSPPSRDEAVQLFVRGHKRNESSKGSVVSIPSRKRPAPLLGRARPETKVYFGSTGQISSLIDSISRGLESGSFNIVPNDPTSPFFGSQWNPEMEQQGTPSAMNGTGPANSTQSPSGFLKRSSQSPSHQPSASMTSSESKQWTMEQRLEDTWNTVHSASSR